MDDLVWMVAARFTSIAEAAAARSALDISGIETYLGDDADALAVMVHDGDVARARGVIGTSSPEKTQEEVLTCRDCGSSDLLRIPRVRLFLLISAIFLGIAVAVGQTMFGAIGLIAIAAGVAVMPAYRCRNCGVASASVASRKGRPAPLPGRSDLVEQPCPQCGAVNVRIHRRCESCGFALR